MPTVAEPQSFQIRREPPRTTVEAERAHRKSRLAAAYRIFALRGYDHGLAGHITARDPEYPDRFWVAPIGPWFGHIRVSDLVLVDHAGRILQGEGPINEAGFAIHSALHKARPDVTAAAHAHSIHGKAWSALGRLLDPITQDSCFFYERHGLYADYTGIVFDRAEGERIAAALGEVNRALILQNHGILTVGKSVEGAVANYVAFENACQTQLLAEAAGTVKLIRPDVARHTRGQAFDSDLVFDFRPLWERVLREQPDFLV